MYKHLYGNETIAVAGGQQADWSIYASRNGSKNYLMLINRTAATAVMRVLKVVTAAGDRLLRIALNPHSVSIVAF
jgi:hypothetical protein